MVEKKKSKNKIIVEEAKEALEVVDTPIKNKEKDLTESLQRLQAEFENFRRRTEKEKSENMANANASLISQLLEVLDNFKLSLKHNKDEGVKLIYDDLTRVLEKQGLKEISTKEKFNPEIHEALMQEKGKEDGNILEEFQKGYTLNGKLLRASKVKISKTSTE